MYTYRGIIDFLVYNNFIEVPENAMPAIHMQPREYMVRQWHGGSRIVVSTGCETLEWRFDSEYRFLGFSVCPL